MTASPSPNSARNRGSWERGWPTRLGLVAAGLGITALPRLAAASVPAGVHTVAVEDPSWFGRSAVAVTEDPPTAEVAVVVGALRQEAALVDGAR